MLEVMTEELGEGMVVGGRFRLDRPLGHGGMGEVWAATHTLTGKALALKFLKASRADDPRSHARLLLEARAACSIRHPNIAEVHDILELESGLPFLVMDLLEGETLFDRLAREDKLSPLEAARIFLPIVEAIAAAHVAGVVHRDLKPANIFLSIERDGTVRPLVLDFGIAKLLPGHRPAEPALTTTGELVGTSFYMAPEQVFAEEDIDARADVWSLGLALYESLSGRRPTQRESVGQVLSAITREPIPSIAQSTPGIPAPLARLLARMLARPRDERPSLDEVQAVLRAILEPSVAPVRVVRRSALRLVGVVGLGMALVAFGLVFHRRAGDGSLPVVPVMTAEPTMSASTTPPAVPSPPPSVTSSASMPGRPTPAAASVSGHAPSVVSVVPSHRPAIVVDAGSPRVQTSGIILTHDRK